MAKYSNDTVDLGAGKSQIWVTEEDDPTTRRLAYEIDKNAKEIILHTNDFCIDQIKIEGFSSLPEGFNPNGYMNSVSYHMSLALLGAKIKKLTISKTKESKTKKVRNKDEYEMVLNQSDFNKLRSEFSIIKTETTEMKKNATAGHFYNIFPKVFAKTEVTAKNKSSKVIKNLDSSIIEHLGPTDLQVIESFIVDLLENKYKMKHLQFKQIARTKVKVDTIAIDTILKVFDDNITKNISEADWGKFLLKNLFLLDSKYVKVFPEINVILGGQRKVDFGMIDTKGFLDIYEIKKADTKLLSTSKDRGNFYWSTDANKAIMQAEKYLFNAERKAAILAEDVNREKKVSIKVIKPRAYLIIGNTSQLDNEEKIDDFRILRSSLKNVTILTFDELLEGLENQKNKYFDQIVN